MKKFRPGLWAFRSSMLVTLASGFLSVLNILRWTFGIALYPFLFTFAFMNLRGSMRFNFNPDIRVIEANEIPLDIWLGFERNRHWLARDGFEYICDAEISNAMQMRNDKVSVKLYFRALAHRSQPVLAGIISLRSMIGEKNFESHDYVGFSSDASEGVLIETNNLSMPDPFPFLDGVFKHQFPDIDVPRHLYQLHLQILAASPYTVPQWPHRPQQEEAIQSILDHYHHEIQKYCEAGYTVDDGNGYASYTTRGTAVTSHRYAGAGKILFNRATRRKYRDAMTAMGIKLDEFMNTEEFTPVIRMPFGRRMQSLHQVMAMIRPLLGKDAGYRLSGLSLDLKILNNRCQLSRYDFTFYRNFMTERDIKMEQELEFVYDNNMGELQELQGSVYESLTEQQQEQVDEAEMDAEEYAEYKKEIQEALEADKKALAELREREGIELGEEDDKLIDEEDYDEDYDEEEVNQTLIVDDQVRDLSELIPVLLQLMQEHAADPTQEVDLSLQEGDEQQSWYGSFNGAGKFYQFNIDARSLEVIHCGGTELAGYPMQMPKYMDKMMNRISRQLDDMDD